MTAGSVLARLGALLAAAALGTIWVLRIRTERAVYVSEMGGDGEPGAAAFALALGAVGIAGIFLGTAELIRPGRRRGEALVGWCLFIAGIAFIFATLNPCTSGCPVPGSAAHTVRDTIHITAAILGFTLVAVAMLTEGVIGRTRIDRVLARGCAVAVAVIAGLGGILALAKVGLVFGSWCEFLATSIAIAWCVARGFMLGRSTSRSPGRDGSKLVGIPA